jgi:hypothetical protein
MDTCQVGRHGLHDPLPPSRWAVPNRASGVGPPGIEQPVVWVTAGDAATRSSQPSGRHHFPLRPLSPLSGAGGDTQDREPGEADCRCEELPVLGNSEPASDARSPPALARKHEVGLLGLYLGPVGLVNRLASSGRPVAAGPPGDGEGCKYRITALSSHERLASVGDHGHSRCLITEISRCRSMTPQRGNSTDHPPSRLSRIAAGQPNG